MMQNETRENRFKWVGLQPSLHLLSLACICVFLGCKHGVWLFTRRTETGESDAQQEVLGDDQAYWFPIMGSCTLFGLFLIYKFVGFDWVKMLISSAVVFMCMF